MILTIYQFYKKFMKWVLKPNKENQEKGIACTYEDIVADVQKRDYIDSHRAFAPLKPAPDAIHLDTSDLTIDEVVAEVNKIIDKKLAENK